MPGRLWVTNPFTQIYIYARKAPPRGLVQQVEIRDVVPGLRERHSRSAQSVRLLVFGPGSAVPLPRSYRTVLVHGVFTVLEVFDGSWAPPAQVG